MLSFFWYIFHWLDNSLLTMHFKRAFRKKSSIPKDDDIVLFLFAFTTAIFSLNAFCTHTEFCLSIYVFLSLDRSSLEMHFIGVLNKIVGHQQRWKDSLNIRSELASSGGIFTFNTFLLVQNVAFLFMYSHWLDNTSLTMHFIKSMKKLSSISKDGNYCFNFKSLSFIFLDHFQLWFLV